MLLSEPQVLYLAENSLGIKRRLICQGRVTKEKKVYNKGTKFQHAKQKMTFQLKISKKMKDKILTEKLSLISVGFVRSSSSNGSRAKISVTVKQCDHVINCLSKKQPNVFSFSWATSSFQKIMSFKK